MNTRYPFLYRYSNAIDHLTWPDAVTLIHERIGHKILTPDDADWILSHHPRATPQLVTTARVTYRLTS